MGILIVIYFLLTRLQEFVDTQLIMTFLAVTTGLFTVIASFITWRIDRNRLTVLEQKSKDMKAEIKENREAVEKATGDIYKEMNDSYKELTGKVDDVKMYLLHSKITLKGENKK